MNGYPDGCDQNVHDREFGGGVKKKAPSPMPWERSPLRKEALQELAKVYEGFPESCWPRNLVKFRHD